MQQSLKRFGFHRHPGLAQFAYQCLTFRSQHVEFSQMHQHRR